MTNCVYCKNTLEIVGSLICGSCKAERNARFLNAQIGLMKRLDTEEAHERLIEYIKEAQDANI